MTATKSQKSSDSSPFIKQLASSDRSIRDRALSSLRTYLSRSTPFTSLDFLKLWKGLHYCMFMSDKPRNQQRLARDLAALTDVLAKENVLPWLQAFWKTMAREWGGIDSLRMDKYLYLIRCYVNKGFEVCAKRGWEVDAYQDVLDADGGPLSVRDVKVPVGLKLHVLDIWVDELEKVDEDKKRAPVEHVMKPIRKLQKDSLVKSVRVRAKESLEDERLFQGMRWRTEEDRDASEVDGDDVMSEDDGQVLGDDAFGGFDD
ncbi:Putative nucleolar, Nop52 [Septoria linicola]|uniref:Nucleolar, Nop52 n=1 Tax=Septoria linicola TaxID=215465 RepID=A0A9Q9EFL1_9PEZI|nr:putative nucleolar, Nop52 [Septoria linicola]USW47792.1 Putative nucleolar, Nop52 [Septoria linicola]